MKQFEYLELDIGKSIYEKSPFGSGLMSKEEKLAELGKEGWEAVGGHGIDNRVSLFKREIEPDNTMEQEHPHRSRPRCHENEYSYSE
jgi:hypothetical protein